MTDTTPTRRSIVKAAAWSAPVIAMAVATPLAAASTVPATPAPAKNRLRLTNATATVGKKPNTIYANTTVQVIDGPASVENVVLVVSLSRGGSSIQKVWALIGGWGHSGRVDMEFPGIPKGEPVDVTFSAHAAGVASIAQSVRVVTPSWWS